MKKKLVFLVFRILLVLFSFLSFSCLFPLGLVDSIFAEGFKVVGFYLFVVLDFLFACYLVCDLTDLIRLLWKLRQYKRMGIPVGEPDSGSSYCDGCPYEKVCNQCPYNPSNPGGYA